MGAGASAIIGGGGVDVSRTSVAVTVVPGFTDKDLGLTGSRDQVVVLRIHGAGYRG